MIGPVWVLGLFLDRSAGPIGVCVECLVGKQNKPTLFKVTEPSSVSYRTPSACAKMAAYPDPPPVIPVPEVVDLHQRWGKTNAISNSENFKAQADNEAKVMKPNESKSAKDTLCR